MALKARSKLLDIIEGAQYQKNILITAVIVLLILELNICLVAINYTGNRSKVIVSDAQGQVVYETAGQVLSNYDRQSFESTFGPIANYKVQVQMDSRPFPFRAWLAAAIGIPVGLILLLAFLIRVYLTLMYGDDNREGEDEWKEGLQPKGLGSILRSLQGFSIFFIGFGVIIMVLVIWLIPDMVGNMARVSIDTVKEFKWFFLGVAMVAIGFLTWVIYLKYRLSQKFMEHQLELEKFKIEKQLPSPEGIPTHLLPER
jgi:hypothetical protein